MAAETSLSRIHLWSGLVILGVFLAGAATGAGLHAWLRHPGAFPPPPMLGRLPPPYSELGLSPEQQSEARAIAERYRPAMESVLEQTFPRMRAIQQEMDRELRSILTEPQARRFDELRARRPPQGSPRPPGFGPPGLGPPPDGPQPGPPAGPPHDPSPGPPPGRPPP